MNLLILVIIPALAAMYHVESRFDKLDHALLENSLAIRSHLEWAAKDNWSRARQSEWIDKLEDLNPLLMVPKEYEIGDLAYLGQHVPTKPAPKPQPKPQPVKKPSVAALPREEEE